MSDAVGAATTQQALPPQECAPIRGIVAPLVVALPAGDSPAPADTLAAAPAAAAELEALPETSRTAGLLRDFLATGLETMARTGQVPTSFVDDLDRLDRYCPTG